MAVIGANFDEKDSVKVSWRSVQDGQTGTINCRFVVDASGQNAVIGRQLGVRKMDETFKYMAVWGYYDNSDYVDFDGQTHTREDIGTVPPVTFISSLEDAADTSWCWHIPMRQNTSVGLVMPIAQMKRMKSKDMEWEEFFVDTMKKVPITNKLLAKATLVKDSIRIIRNYSYQSTQLVGPGYFLIGDSAGFVDPIFSVGVVLAMYSAYAASWAIDDSLKKPENTKRNQELFERQLRGRMEIARSLALPKYYSEDAGVSDLAKDAIKLERQDVRQLMHAVSMLTTRSDNFKEMVNHEDVPEVDPSMVKIIEKANI